jgi:glycosidase
MKANLIINISLFWLIGLFSCSPSSTEKDNSQPPIEKSTSFKDAPEWAKHVVWYQIFVERFRNGDSSNDPRPEDIQGSYPGFVPENWQITPWTSDWYKSDPYFNDIHGAIDHGGNKINNFAQKAQLRRYGGDLQGVIDQLDYLDSLGVSAIYFNPLNDAPSLHKYDARNWRHIDRNFGPDPDLDAKLMAEETPDDPSTWVFTSADSLFIKLIDLLHSRGMKVILDYSWNHTGSSAWSWQDILKNQADSKYANWYEVRSFDDPRTDSNEFTYRGWAGVPDLPELKETTQHDPTGPVKAYNGDIYADEAKKHIYDISRRWLDPNGDGDPSDGIDGFRLDVAAEIGLDFWREYRKVVREVNPNAYLIGEVWWEEWPDKLLDPEPFLRGDVFDAVMNYRWYRAAREFFGGNPQAVPVTKFTDSLRRFSSNLRPTNTYAFMNVAASHDVPRVSTSLFNKNAYKYNSTPMGDSTYKINRPDRETYEALRLLLIQQFTYIGAPHIWAGDEMGMWGADDPDTRKPLIWPDYSFEPETTHPLGSDRPVDSIRFDTDLFNFYKKLITIRNDNKALRTGDINYLLEDTEQNTLAYSRTFDEEMLIAVFNCSEGERKVELSGVGEENFRELLSGSNYTTSSGKLTLLVPGRTGLILERI